MTVHALWNDNTFHLWADQGPRSGALPHDALRVLVGELTNDGLLAQSAVDATLELYLPHDDAGPLFRGAEPNGIVHLAPLEVPSLAFTATQVADLLLPFREDVPDAAGESLVYFARLHRYVLAKIGGRQFYPDLDQVTVGGYSGVWRLLTHDPAEVERLSRFATAMPPVARALVPDSRAEPPMEPGRAVETFVSAVADAFIRRAVSTDPFFTRVHNLAAAPAAAGDVRWLSALLGKDHALRGGNTDSNALLAELVRNWVGKLDEGRSDEPWKLVFSLREPALPDNFEEDEDSTDGGDLTWRLVLQLRSPGEDSTLINAEELWDEGGDPAGVFGRGVAERKAQLTADLARAVEVSPLLSSLAQSPKPSETVLSTTDANAFIRTWSHALRGAGFSVELPEWADFRERGLGLLLSVDPDGIGPDGTVLTRRAGPFDGMSEIPSGHFGLDSLLNFDWQIAVGDLRLSHAEFKALAQRGSPLVRYKGQWLQIDPDASRKVSNFLTTNGQGKMTLAQALRTAYGASPTDLGLPVIGLSGKGWLDQLLSQSPSLKVTGTTQPTAFLGTLRPYQLRGLDWMLFLDRLGLGGCLADDMGLGKTVQLISLLLSERESAVATGAPRPGPTLLFAPTSVVGNWMKELQRFGPQMKVIVHHGPDRLTGDDFLAKAQASDVVITSYALAHRDVEDLKKARWHRLAVDEAQKIKNPSAAASVAIRSIPAPRRIALTGTPIENHLSELWSIMELLNPGLLGTAADFRERFAVPVEKLGDKGKAAQLRKMIQPFVLRRTKTDPAVAGDLPEKMEMKVYCNLTAEQAAAYERITAEMLGQIDTATGIRRRGLILAALTRLKQICDHPALLESDDARAASSLDRRSGKCERILEMLEEVVQEGDAALVFTQYREMGHLLEKMITERLKANVQFLHGGTTARQRDQMIENFQAPNSPIKIFILSLRAGGLGLNLTAANHVFHFDRWWNPAVEQQATDRAHRIGQTRTVQVHQFVCVGTLEERIDKLLQDKLLLADQVVGAGDDWLTDMSTDQLRGYLSLGQDAVSEF
jgi:superfamily II DNA or RNA helicase